MLHLANGVISRRIICWCVLAACVAVYKSIETYDASLAAIGNHLHLLAVARLETYGRCGGNVKVATKGQCALKLKVAVHLEEVEVRAHLNGAVARVAHGELCCLALAVVIDILLAEDCAADDNALVGRESLLAGIELLRHRRGGGNRGVCVFIHI